MEADTLIIGAGHSSGILAITLRKNNYNGSILLLGEEEYLPYQRPPLSKSFISKEISQDRLYLRSKEFYKKNNINISTNSRVVDIEKDKKLVTLENGNKVKYHNLVIATGSQLNKIDLTTNRINTFYLRDIKDSLKIKDSFKKAQEMVLIGAGYIGLEIASVAAKKNINTTVVEMEDRVMARSVCPEVSDFFLRKHQKEKINFIFNTSIIDVKKDSVILSNGESLTPDVLIIGIGVKPNTGLAKKAGLLCEDGIIVNEFGETSEKNIYACGDCANHYNQIFGTRLRLESVHNATEQAINIAGTIIGKKTPYNQVPWFWSDQYNLKLQIAGISQNHDEYVLRGNLSEEKFAIFYLRKSKIIAVEAVNDSKAFINGKKLIAMKASIPLEKLKDINFDLGKYQKKN